MRIRFFEEIVEGEALERLELLVRKGMWFRLHAGHESGTVALCITAEVQLASN